MRRTLNLLLTLCALLAGWVAPAWASPQEPAKASLVADVRDFVPGVPFTAALRLYLDPGWHTYWRDPGDAGLPTTLSLDLPPGVHAGPLEWPRPQVFHAAGGLTSYGYESTAYLLVPITVDPGYESHSLALKGTATWLVCKDLCLPGKDRVRLDLPRGSRPLPSAQAGVLAALGTGLGLPPPGYHAPAAALGAPTPPAPVAAPSPVPVPAPAPRAGGLGAALLLALLGGMLLNLMPCVLPVLSLKALSFVKQAHEGRARGLAQAFAYAAGVLASFWALAALVLLLKSGGRAVGWGFQFQQPAFVLGMAGLLVAFSLNLFGVFEILLPGSALQGLSGASRGSGLAGAFGQGLVMTLLATPCTAPFLGTALGFAFAAPAGVLVAVFTAVALGLALPYVLLAAVPGAHAWLPKPGNWMLRFKEAMGFLLLATVVWLLWVLSGLVGSDGGALAGAWLLLLAVAVWVWGRFGGLERSPGARRWAFVAALALAAGSGIWLWPKVLAGQPAAAAEDALWKPWSPALAADLHARGVPVFVDFGAQWCWTCKVNERVVLGDPAVLQAFRERHVALLKADDTRNDPAITAALRAHGRAGVPMYLYQPPQGPERLLPELLTPAEVLKALGPPAP